jgi:membrane-associated phospholipid phosphatase
LNRTNRLLIVAIVFSYSGCLSSPYHLTKLDIAYVALSGTAMGVSMWYKERNEYAASEILSLSKSDLNPIDRRLLRPANPTFRTMSDVAYVGSYLAVPLSIGFLREDDSRPRFSLFKNKGEEWLVIPVMYLETVFATTAAFNLAKGSVRRYRPAAYLDKEAQARDPDAGVSRSFFSGHAGIISASAIFIVKTLDDYNGENMRRPLLWLSGIAVALAGSELRHLCGRHHFTDVIAGSVVGGGIGFLIPHLHKKKDRKVSFLPYTNGTAGGVLMSYKL